MTFYADLSPYTYIPETVPEGAVVLNVGWLDGEHPFTTGQPPERFIEELGILCVKHPFAKTRGFHWCEICVSENADYSGAEEIDGEELIQGSAEVRVIAVTGEWLAAPNLIYHYVRRHSYLPPELFIEAVLARRLPPDELRDYYRFGQ